MVGEWRCRVGGVTVTVFGDGVMEGFTSKTELMGLTEVGCAH